MINELIEGLKILETYRDKKNGYSLGAEHDILYSHSTDHPLNMLDIILMINLGWFQPYSSNKDGDFGPTDYDPEEPWAIYI